MIFLQVSQRMESESIRKGKIPFFCFFGMHRIIEGASGQDR